MKVLLVQMGDTHFGSRTAVCPPIVELEDGANYEANAAQKWTWDRFLDCAIRIKGIAEDFGAEKVHVFHMGDIVDGDKHASWQRIGPEVGAQLAAAQQGLDAFFTAMGRPTSIRFLRGTPAHAGSAHGYEEAVVRRLEDDGYAVVHADKRRRTHYRVRFVTETGHRVDALHHDTVNGRRPWTRHASVSRLAEVVFDSYCRANPENPRAPHVVMRGHTHFFKDSGESTPVRAVVSPAWQHAYDWIEKVAPEEYPEQGAVVWKLETGKRAQIEPILYQPRQEDPWKT